MVSSPFSPSSGDPTGRSMIFSSVGEPTTCSLIKISLATASNLERANDVLPNCWLPGEEGKVKNSVLDLVVKDEAKPSHRPYSTNTFQIFKFRSNPTHHRVERVRAFAAALLAQNTL
jgi:hypothetical protein